MWRSPSSPALLVVAERLQAPVLGWRQCWATRGLDRDCRCQWSLGWRWHCGLWIVVLNEEPVWLNPLVYKCCLIFWRGCTFRLGEHMPAVGFLSFLVSFIGRHVAWMSLYSALLSELSNAIMLCGKSPEIAWCILISPYRIGSMIRNRNGEAGASAVLQVYSRSWLWYDKPHLSCLPRRTSMFVKDPLLANSVCSTGGNTEGFFFFFF